MPSPPLTPEPPSRRAAVAVAVARWALAVALLVWLGAIHWPQSVDDTVISANYARQWAEGHGLTWTTGERVEGYSNFLLVALLAAGIRLGADAALLAQQVALGASALILAVMSARLPRGLSATLALLAVAVLGPLDYWGMMGLEGPLFGLLLGLGWASVATERWGLGMALLSLASVTRPEGPLYLGLAVLTRLAGPRRWRRGDGLALLSVGLVGAYHGVRVAWFDAWWPAPYLVKLAAVPWTTYGLAQVVGDWLVFLPALIAVGLAVRLERRALLVAAVPFLAQSLLLWRASGDWMTHGRLILPGAIATALTAARLGLPRDARWPSVALGVALVVLSAAHMPVGYGTLDLERRAVPSLAEARKELTRGLDTPLSEDVLWACRNVPSGDRVMAVDAGMLGAIPELRLIDSRGLTHRGFAEAAATGREEAAMRALVADANERPEWMRIANWDGAPLPTLPDWLASVYHLREEVRYGAARIGWYAVHDSVADEATARRRLDALWSEWPSQPFLAWHAALQRADEGDMAGAMAIAELGRARWPGDARFSEAPASLSFPTGPFGLDRVAGRGVGLYWNTSVRSRLIQASERSALRLRLDVDSPGDEGARAEITWTGPCGEQQETVEVRRPERLEAPPCASLGPSRVQVRFTNDASGPEGDRNLYATLVQSDDGDH